MKDEIKEILGEITNIRDNFADGVLIDLFNKIEDYITNLQEENRQTKLLKERYQLEKEDYKSRCEKTIEEIDKVEEHCTTPIFNIIGFLNDIKNTLNGGDDNG